MKIEVDFKQEELHYLRQYAALQFPGSVENLSTKSPLHLLQQETEVDSVRINIEDAEVGDKFSWGDAITDGYQYDTVEDVVKAALDMEGLSDEEIEEMNEEREEAGEEPFQTYEDSNSYSIESYLEDYGIADEVFAYRSVTAWDTMAVAFSKRELADVKKDVENHIFGKTRIFSAAGMSYDRTSGDYYPMMGALLSIGEQLLAQQVRDDGIQVREVIVMTPAEIERGLRANPNCPFTAAEYAVTDKGQQLRMLVVVDGRVVASPFKQGEQRPVWKASVAVNGYNCHYPFEHHNLSMPSAKAGENEVLSAAERMYLFTKYMRQ